MLLNLREYHRPRGETRAEGVSEALELLGRTGLRTAVIAGGDALLGSADRTVDAVVDLQDLGLDAIAFDEPAGAIRIGAMVTRAELSISTLARNHGCGLLAEAAWRWRGSVQRNRDTVGGAVVVAASEDPLVAALLAFGACLTVQDSRGQREVPLKSFIADRRAVLDAPALITELVIPAQGVRTGAAIARVGRTPADRPIVLAVAMLSAKAGRCTEARLALGGVAEAPILAGMVEGRLVGKELDIPAIAEVASLVSRSVEPRGDERGSASYRQTMVEVLSRRALKEAWSYC